MMNGMQLYGQEMLMVHPFSQSATIECTCCNKCRKTRPSGYYSPPLPRIVEARSLKALQEQTSKFVEATKTKIFKPASIPQFVCEEQTPNSIYKKRKISHSSDVYYSYKKQRHVAENVSDRMYTPRYNTYEKTRHLSVSDVDRFHRIQDLSRVEQTSNVIKQGDYNDIAKTVHENSRIVQSILTPLSPPITPPSLTSSPNGRRGSYMLSEYSNMSSFDSASSLSGSEEEAELLDNKTHKKQVERAKYERTIKLYKFLIDLLEDKHPCVIWITRESGLFKITDSEKLAQLWGEVKLNSSMTYEKLARSFRHYYKKGILDSGATVMSPVSKCGKRKLYYKFSAATLKRFLSIDEV